MGKTASHRKFVVCVRPGDSEDLEIRKGYEALPDQKAAREGYLRIVAAQEAKGNKEAQEANPDARVNHHHANFLKRWWMLSYPREEMTRRLHELPRYVVCSQVTKRPIFAFVDVRIRPNAALIVFSLDDDYSFGILQSSIHWEWFMARCSSLKGDYRYTSDTVFDSFCWPQTPGKRAIQNVAKAAVHLRKLRDHVMRENKWTLRQIYRTLEEPGENPLRNATTELDDAVCVAYGVPSHAEPLDFLLLLNHECANRENRGENIVGPGIPPGIPHELVKLSDDRIRP